MRTGWRGALCVIALLTSLALAIPAGAGATILPPWGSDLSQTPTRDTANGASSTNSAGTAPQSSPWISPDPHDAADTAIWNASLANGAAVAPQGGQVQKINVKGCAVADPTVPNGDQTSHQGSTSAPVNTVNFQALTPNADGSYTPGVVAANFLFPFCKTTDYPQGTADPTTVTTFVPIHMCLNQGQTVDFYDIGGFISQGPRFWYPQGVPFQVIAPVTGSVMNSFSYAVDQPSYKPGAQPMGAQSGFGVERGEELMMQVVEGVGDDAYGLCPGGHANEPSNSSNQITCVYDHNPEPGKTDCNPPAGGGGTGGGGTGGGHGTGGGGGGGGKTVAPGVPQLGHQAINGVPKRKPRLRFVVTAGSHAPNLRSLVVSLPSGLQFSKSLARLRKAIAVTDQGPKVPFTAQLSHGRLTLTFAGGTARAEVSISYPGLLASAKLAGLVKRGRTKSLRFGVVASDTAGAVQRLSAALAV